MAGIGPVEPDRLRRRRPTHPRPHPRGHPVGRLPQLLPPSAALGRASVTPAPHPASPACRRGHRGRLGVHRPHHHPGDTRPHPLTLPGHPPAPRGKRPAGPVAPAHRRLPLHHLRTRSPPCDHPSSSGRTTGIEYARHPRAATDSEGRRPETPHCAHLRIQVRRPAARLHSAVPRPRPTEPSGTAAAQLPLRRRLPPRPRRLSARHLRTAQWALRAAPRTRNGSHTEVTLGYLCRNRAMRSASHRPRSARHPPPRRHTPARKDQDHPKFLSGTACSSHVNICSPHPKVPIAPTAPAHEHRVITRASHPSLLSSPPHLPALIVTASHRAAGRVCCTALYHPSTARRDTRPQPREPRQGED
jgi:hypothetical protein